MEISFSAPSKFKKATVFKVNEETYIVHLVHSVTIRHVDGELFWSIHLFVENEKSRKMHGLTVTSDDNPEIIRDPEDR